MAGRRPLCDWFAGHHRRVNWRLYRLAEHRHFIPMFTNDAGEFAPLAFMARAVAGAYCPVILNSIALSIAVGIGCTFFGLVLAIYTTRIARRSAVIGRIFSILPIVTPPFVVGLGVTLMMGRSGYVTEFMVEWFGLTNTNWLYGFTGIWLAQVLAFPQWRL